MNMWRFIPQRFRPGAPPRILTYSVFGGNTPMVAVGLIEKQHDDMAFAWYIVIAAAISLVVVLSLKRAGS